MLREVLRSMTYKYIKWFDEISKEDIPIVGGKGANLGELTQKGVSVPPGFCITAKAYSDFISKEELGDKIRRKIEGLDIEDSAKLQMRSLEIRDIINNSPMPNEIKEEIERAYKEFSIKTRIENPFVAVRSSATAEDLPEASFAGQQDTYLHISRIDEVLRYKRNKILIIFRFH